MRIFHDSSLILATGLKNKNCRRIGQTLSLSQRQKAAKKMPLQITDPMKRESAHRCQNDYYNHGKNKPTKHKSAAKVPSNTAKVPLCQLQKPLLLRATSHNGKHAGHTVCSKQTKTKLGETCCFQPRGMSKIFPFFHSSWLTDLLFLQMVLPLELWSFQILRFHGVHKRGENIQFSKKKTREESGLDNFSIRPLANFHPPAHARTDCVTLRW